MSIPVLAAPATPANLQRAAGAVMSVRVLSLDELAEGLARLQPPPAYRLSLDSGIEYKNVRRAFAQPRAARLLTWRKLLRSLDLRLIAVDPAAGGAWAAHGSGGDTAIGACSLAAPIDGASLAFLRQCRGWSRREMARRAGVGVDAIGSLESGGGMVESLVRVCGALGLELLLALPPDATSLGALWEQRAGRCLDAPAQFPASRRRAHDLGPPGTPDSRVSGG
jgi:transcriptional regulator with XRE-family HTH domain